MEEAVGVLVAAAVAVDAGPVAVAVVAVAADAANLAGKQFRIVTAGRPTRSVSHSPGRREADGCGWDAAVYAAPSLRFAGCARG